MPKASDLDKLASQVAKLNERVQTLEELAEKLKRVLARELGQA